MEAWIRNLRDEIRGEALDDDVSLAIYSTDASVYSIEPLAVVLPRDLDDVRTTVRHAREQGVAILPRGGGTSLAGQTVGRALIVDFSKSMNRLLEVDIETRTARVEPGIVRDELNALLKPHGLHFAPDPATTSRANVGGMIGNNSSGTKSILYGKTIDHVVALDVLLADGTELRLEEIDDAQWAAKAARGDREGEIYRRFDEILQREKDEILTRFPKTMRRVGGYPLDEFVDEDGVLPRRNPAKLFVGSEGTLGLTLEATIRLEPLPQAKALCLAHFRDVAQAVQAVDPVLPLEPSAVEILDQTVLDMARRNRGTAPLCDVLIEEPGAALLIEFYGDTAEDVLDRARRSAAKLDELRLTYAAPVLDDEAAQARVWELRKSGLGLMLGVTGDRKPLAFIEDAAIPIPVLPEYVERMVRFCDERDVDMALYAHASVGVIHLRPILDLRRGEDIALFREIAEHSFELVVEYEGSWSSEHGDGLVRSPFNERFFGTRLYETFREIKTLFDPQGLMNPGKIVDAPPMDQNLRYGTDYEAKTGILQYRYRAEESYAAAVEMCSGVGACRKTAVGTMCPSYMATRDEIHSTRGRANALRLVMSGRLPAESVREAMDLCLGCKACKAECPSSVDMAKLKSETMQTLHDKTGASLRDQFVARAPELLRAASGFWAPLLGSIGSSGIARRAQETLFGIHRGRALPAPAREPFLNWWKRRGGSPTAERKIILFVDTYLGWQEPKIGRAAVELLESCGFEVVVEASGCCQRPRISQGFLREARLYGEPTLRALDRRLQDGSRVVVCEPSCASALTDDLPDLIDDLDLARRIRDGVGMIDDLLAEEFVAGRLSLKESEQEILIHGHCHQKALFGTSAMKTLLPQAREVDSGCCGMAGAFGYEKEHFELSRKIGEDRLFPAVRDLDENAQIIACGTSCRHQISDLTGRRAAHLVEVLAHSARGRLR